jgi:Tfp pilus assembly protein PilZ
MGKEFTSMAQTVDQIEKHTIITRLSVSIYKMDDSSLLTILKLLENNTDTEDVLHPLMEKSGNPATQHQMIIARIFVLINQMDKDTLLQRLRPFQHPDFRWIREYPRLSCYLMVDFAANGRAYRSCIRDISASGVFIETTDAFEPGQELALCFALSESDEMLPFKIRGQVTRIYPDGIGVRYENVTDYQRAIISALLDKLG